MGVVCTPCYTAGRLRPEHSKSGKGRQLVLDGDDLPPLMERRWASRVIPGPNGTTEVSPLVFHRYGQRIVDFRKGWMTACQAAGVPGRLFHDLRRTTIRNLVRSDVRETVAMAISGHRTRAVFDRYNITSESDLREAARRVSTYMKHLPAASTVVPLVTRAEAR